MHGVNNKEDIDHDLEATGSHLDPSLFVCILETKHKMSIDNIAAVLKNPNGGSSQ